MLSFFNPLTIKPVDLVFKVSVKLDWYQVCYIDCVPMIVYKEVNSEVWSSITLIKSNDNEFPEEFLNRGSCCKRNRNENIFQWNRLINNEYFLVYSADECYPWIRTSTTNEDERYWGVRIQKNLYFLSESQYEL